MTSFLIIGGLFGIAALFFVVLPLLKQRGGNRVSRSVLNLAVYRDQLRELDADVRAGTLSAEQYAKAKQEIAQAFAQLHPERFSTVGRAMQCRGEWPRILNDPGAIDALYQEATGFLRWVRDLP